MTLSILNKLIQFAQFHFERGIKFAAIGTLGAFLSLTIQYILTDFLGIWYIYSGIVAILCAFVHNYFLNYYLTFRDLTKNTKEANK